VTIQSAKTELLELNLEPFFETYYNLDNCYAVYKCYDLNTKIKSDGFWDTTESYKEITIVGNFQRLTVGKKYVAKAEKIYHKTYGEQFKISNIYSPESTTQEDEQQFIQFLITERQLKNILSVYPMPVTAIMDGTFDYKKVKGFGQKNYELLKTKVEANYNNMKAMSVLGQYNIKFNQIKKLVEFYGSADLAIQMVFDNPYILYKEIDGIGFKKADEIAQAIGFDFNSPKRILAGIMYSLEQEEQKGNTWGYISEVKSNAEEVLKLTIENIDEFLDSPDFYIDKENDIIALTKTYNCELDITEELYRLNDAESTSLFSDEEVEKYVDEIEQKLGISYTDEQKQLFYEVNKNNVIVLTGWAGTGKTFTLNGCLKMIDKKTNNILLAASTAKASKVLEKSTGRKTSTIHRLLQWMPDGFMYNEQNPLDTDVIIIDEISMCDIWLFRSLLRAIPSECKLILVGDPAQLESVATGNVLHDIINSECFPVVKLQTVFRQALESGILSAATDVRQNIKPYDSESESLELGKTKDCRIWFGEKTDTAKRIAMIYKSCLKKWSIDDIMTIVPMKKSESGVNNLNSILQEIANPQDGTKNQLDFSFRILREGDRVMHTKNDYNAEWLDKNYEFTGLMGIFNGDTGRIKEIKSSERLIYVDYGDKIIEYHSGNFDQLQLSFCITCHKSQGSQSPVVIMGIDISAYMNLKRSLVYTSITRASQQLFIIAERKALSMAIYNDALIQKKTFLCQMLKNYKNNLLIT
jgi:RecD/TraA family predicted helicase